MLKLLQKIFSRTSSPPSSQIAGKDGGPMGVAAALDGEAGRADYEQFCAGFCFQPGQNLMQFLERNDLTRVRDWLHWSTPEPEPKAFVQFAVELMRRRMKLWEQPGLSMYLKGRMPTTESQECLSLLAQVLNKPITLYVESEPGTVPEALEFVP